ncbi:MAG: ribosome rescue protein RqcH [Candidatus Bathyarchaeota archaeon]|nr:ribosome rescue protein RqcH [Candidatus Bathyarchaeota archaeon]
MSNFDIAAITSEFRQMIIDKHIDNVYHLNQKTLLIRIKPGPLFIILEAGKRVHLTNYLVKTPPKPIQFCMVLRKYLSRGRIVKIDNPKFERIIELSIESKGKNYRIIVESFKRGNIILVDQDGKIIAALKPTIMKDRKILARESYKSAPSSKISFIELTKEGLEKLKHSDKVEIERAIMDLVALDGLYTKEILSKAEIVVTKTNDLSNNDIERIYGSVKDLMKKISKGPYEPTIILDQVGNQVDLVPFSLNIYNTAKKKSFESFNKATDEYFSNIASDIDKEELDKQSSKKSAKLQRILTSQFEQKKAFQTTTEVSRKKGELIYQHINEIDHLSQLILSKKKDGNDWKEIESFIRHQAKEGKKPETYFQKMIPKKLEYIIKLEDVDISISLRQKPQNIASSFYNKAKKIETKLIGLNKSIIDIQKKIKKTDIETKETLGKLPELVKRREKSWYEKFYWFQSDGILVLCGRDASNNELLIKRHMEPQDIVLHAEIHGASFALIKTEGKKVDQRIIKEAAQFAASYSKAWTSGVSAVDVYWVKPDQVSKMPPSGQYISKGMFMIRGKRNYIKGIVTRLAICVLKLDEENAMITSVPVSAIKETVLAYIEISPGKTQSGKLAKKILSILTSKVPENYRHLMKNINLDDIQRLIPAGKADII